MWGGRRGSLYVSGKLLTYFSLRAKCWLREGVGREAIGWEGKILKNTV